MPRSIVSVLMLVFLSATGSNGFSVTHRQSTAFRQARTTADSRHPYSMSTVDAPTREDVDRKTKREGDLIGDKQENFQDALRTSGPLEWLEDAMESREMDDPYHILLLSSTFEKPKITVPYVASSLEYVLDMPVDEGTELSQFAYDHGMSCLGTWSREECLGLGRQLQVRDIVCRIVPYCEGGQRGWQAKDANEAGNLRDASYE